MKRTLTILVILAGALPAQLQFKRIAVLPSGVIGEQFGRPICYDTDHNGLKEITYATGSGYSDDPLRWEIWEYRPLNRFRLVYADTGCYPPGPGITSGNFRPFDAGDIDRDGLTDLLGTNEDWIHPDSSFNKLLATYESPTSSSYPKSLSWSFEWGMNPSDPTPPHLRNDLDGDTNRELVAGVSDDSICWGVWENAGNNQNQLVWHSLTPEGYEFAFGDFDGDGRQEFATAFYRTSVLKCVGDNQYQIVYQDTTGLANGYDVFSGDVNGDENPEFFVGFWTYLSQKFDLYMWQATGINTYRRVFVDEKPSFFGYNPGEASKCGDIDGDGVDEIAWAAPKYLYLYKMTGPDQFQQIWQWEQTNAGNGISVTMADVNNDDYDEIIVCDGGVNGIARTSIFEIEAVRVLQPNGGEAYQPGEDHYIKWQTFTPPRCDSMSVLFTPDNGRTLDLLAHGLPPNTDSILWHVPDLTSDSCKIRVITYGPGAQADESDSIFSITPTGLGGNPGPPVYETKLIGAFPNPLTHSTTIKFQIGVGGGPISLHVCDVSGRTVAVLADGVLKSGVYHRDWEVAPTVPNGIYFLSFTAGGIRESQKLILTR
jgi:hypothetical protein